MISGRGQIRKPLLGTTNYTNNTNNTNKIADDRGVFAECLTAIISFNGHVGNPFVLFVLFVVRKVASSDSDTATCMYL